jgi:hypothetical protein
MEIFTYPQMQRFYGIARFFDQVLNQKRFHQSIILGEKLRKAL